MAAAVALAALPASAGAGALVRNAAGANPAAIQTAVDQFRTDLGGTNNGVGGSFPTGRREINWDGVPDDRAEPNRLPFNFFNTTSPRGAVFGSAANIGSQHTFAVSADSSNPTSTAVRFGNVDASYSAIFQTFSAERLFRPVSSTVLDVYFFVPGTSIPATVKGMGVVFADVDSSNTYIEYYAADGTKLAGSSINAASNGLSFLGTSFTAGERVARVQMGIGNRPLQSGNVDGTAGVDVVAMDDFIYGEPQAAPSTFRFVESQVSAAEGTSATVSVVRSGPGPASVDFATADGTAVAGSDYTPASGTLTFAPGESVKTITVPLAADTAVEGDETVNLNLSNPVGGSLGDPSSATLSVLDRDETAPALVVKRVARAMKLRGFLKGVRASVTPSEASSLRFELVGSARRLTPAKVGDVTLASRTLPVAGGTRSVRLKPKRRLLLPAPRRFTTRLRITATDAAGNQTVVTRKIRVRR